MKQKTIYNDDDALYTDAPPEVDEAFDYAVKHNLFLTKKQIDELLNRNTITAPQRRRSAFGKVAAML